MFSPGGLSGKNTHFAPPATRPPTRQHGCFEASWEAQRPATYLLFFLCSRAFLAKAGLTCCVFCLCLNCCSNSPAGKLLALDSYSYLAQAPKTLPAYITHQRPGSPQQRMLLCHPWIERNGRGVNLSSRSPRGRVIQGCFAEITGCLPCGEGSVCQRMKSGKIPLSATRTLRKHLRNPAAGISALTDLS